jgi:hypothetical protein
MCYDDLDDNCLKEAKMIKHLGLLVIFIFFLSGCKSEQPNAVQMWDKSFNTHEAKVAIGSVVFDKDNVPYVYFNETLPFGKQFGELYVKRWDGEQWQILGGNILDESAIVFFRDVIFDQNNNLLVAYLQTLNVDAGETNDNVWFIKRWTGTEWTLVTTGTIPYDAWSDVRLIEDGKHIIVESDFMITYATVKQWTGSIWETIKTFDMSITATTGLDLADIGSWGLDANYNPIRVWIEYDAETQSDYHLFAKHWTGSTWEMLGEQAINDDRTRIVRNPIAAFTYDGQPILTWQELDSYSSNAKSFVKRWTGTAWEAYQEGNLNVDQSKDAYVSSIVNDAQHNPVISFSESAGLEPPRVYYAKAWADGAWKLLDGKSLNIDPTRDAINGHIVFDRNNKAFAVISEAIGEGYHLFVWEVAY